MTHSITFQICDGDSNIICGGLQEQVVKRVAQEHANRLLRPVFVSSGDEAAEQVDPEIDEESIEVEALNVRETESGEDDAYDVDFDIWIGRVEFSGEATLRPCADGRPGYESWGTSLDHWLDGATIERLRHLSDDARRVVTDAIEAATAAAIAEALEVVS